MKELTTIVTTMSSLEIAELTGKRHDHVMSDIRKMLKGLGIDSPEFSGQYKDSTGRSLPYFNLPKRETEGLTNYNKESLVTSFNR